MIALDAQDLIVLAPALDLLQQHTEGELAKARRSDNHRDAQHAHADRDGARESAGDAARDVRTLSRPLALNPRCSRPGLFHGRLARVSTLHCRT